MNLKHLETFVTVAELRSFTAAARKLFMSQPAVSFQIKSLEEDLQVTLFQRGEKRLALTEAGRLIYPEAKKMVIRYQKIKSGIDDLRGLKTGHLVAGASTTPGEYLLPLLIGGFRKKYPGIQVTLRVAGSGQVFHWLREREIDIGVTGSAVSGNWLNCRPWLADELVLIAPPDHPWTGRDVIGIEEMVEEPFILREAGSGTRRSFEQIISLAGVDPARINLSMELGSTRAVITAVQAGLGVSVVSGWAARDALDLGKIKRINSPVDMKRTLYLVTGRHSLDSSVADEFLAFIGDEENYGRLTGKNPGNGFPG
ncbi:MAG: LysR family transcriptional regulator [Peptococcaceae bacterium]|nr:LysR family transcriptional regulator [Peptococcaceae bacterium]